MSEPVKHTLLFRCWRRLDPRTQSFIGGTVVLYLLFTRNPMVLEVAGLTLPLLLLVLGMVKDWLKSLRLFIPMVGMVFGITWISLDLNGALFLSLRLMDLLTASFIFFGTIDPGRLGGALTKMGVPFHFAFTLTTGLRYVPLMGQKFRNIMDAQISRGIDLRPRPGNIRNFMALIVPMLVQAFLLADDLAMAMESRGFSREGRSTRKMFRISFFEYVLMGGCLALMLLLMFRFFG